MISQLLPIRAVTVNLRFLKQTHTAFFPQRQLRSFLTSLMGEAVLKNNPWLWIDTPEAGQTRFQAGDNYRFQLFAGGGRVDELARIMQLLEGLPASFPESRRKGAVFSDNVRLVGFEDCFSLSDDLIYQAGQLNRYDEAWLAKEVDFYADAEELILRFTSPARLKISGERMEQLANVRPYIQDRGQLTENEVERRVIRALANLAPGLAPETEQPGWIKTDDALFWAENVRVREQSGKPPFGGILGPVWFKAVAQSRDHLPHLILGQYYGIGEMRGYGYGRYRLERIDGRGTKPPRAFSRSILQRAGSIDVMESAWRSHAGKHPYYREFLYQRDYRLAGVDRPVRDDEVIDLTDISQELISGQPGTGCLEGRILRQRGRHPRPLAVPPLKQRIAQRAVMETLLPALDKLMYDASFGFRRGRSRLSVKERIQSLVRKGYTWCYEADIDSFFDTVPFAVVENRLRSLFPDDPAVGLIMHWITAPVLFQGHTVERTGGLPQGSPLSPLLANLLLSDLDSDIQVMRLNMLRFADDLVVLCKSRAQAERAARRVEKSLTELDLEIKRSKTRLISTDQGFRFLGYTFVNDLAVDNHRPRNAPFQPLTPETIPPHSWLALLIRQQPALIETLAHDGKGGGKTGTEASHDSYNSRTRNESEMGRTLFIAGKRKTVKRINRRVALFEGDDAIGKYPFTHLHAIVLIGNHTITTPCLTAAMNQNVPVHFISSSGRYQGVAASESPTNEGAELWLQQAAFCQDEARGLPLSRQLVHARLSNQMEVLRQRQRNGPVRVAEAYTKIRQIRRQLQGARHKEALLGFEGAASTLYYRALSMLLPPEFQFEQRSKHPAMDPFCSLLDLGFSTLRAFTGSVIRISGLHPWTGVYHQGLGTHQALASDLMEPFRHVVERTALTLIKRGQLKPAHFYFNNHGHCRLNDEGFRIYYPALIEALNRPVKGRNMVNERSMPEHAYAQALSLLRHIRDVENPFWVFTL